MHVQELIPSPVLFRWDSSLSCGDAAIDFDHQVFFAVLNEVLSLTRSEGFPERSLPEVISVLSAHARRHFEREECLMDRHAYPHRAAHLESHRDLLRNLRSLAACRQSACAHELVSAVDVWLRDHIAAHDRPLLAYAHAAEGNGAALTASAS